MDKAVKAMTRPVSITVRSNLIGFGNDRTHQINREFKDSTGISGYGQEVQTACLLTKCIDQMVRWSQSL